MNAKQNEIANLEARISAQTAMLRERSRLLDRVEEERDQLRERVQELEKVVSLAIDRFAEDSSAGRPDWTPERTRSALEQLIRDANHCITWSTNEERAAAALDLSLAQYRITELESLVGKLEKNKS